MPQKSVLYSIINIIWLPIALWNCYSICDFGNSLKFLKWVLVCKELSIPFMRKRRTVNKLYCKIHILMCLNFGDFLNKLAFIGMVHHITWQVRFKDMGSICSSYTRCSKLLKTNSGRKMSHLRCEAQRGHSAVWRCSTLNMRESWRCVTLIRKEVVLDFFPDIFKRFFKKIYP